MAPVVHAREALGQALVAVDLAFTEPARARRLADQALLAGDAETRSVALRALGLVGVSLQRLIEAEAHLQSAIDVAEDAGLSVRAAEARGSTAYLLVITGRSAQALAAAAEALPQLSGLPRARVLMSRALVLTELGRFRSALGGFDEALDAVRSSGGNPVMEADVLTNRSIVQVNLRDWQAADADLDRAEQLYRDAGHLGKTAMVAHNRGLAAAVRGDVPAALAAYDQAAERYRAAGRGLGTLPLERAETLLSVLLVDEAREVAEQAVLQFAQERNAIDLVHARLLLARAALLGGDWEVASEQATRAGRSASRQGRPGWVALGGYLALRARWESGLRDDNLIRAGRRVAVALDRNGWVVEALDARIVVARAAIAMGRHRTARRQLQDALSDFDGPAEQRARAWHARGLLCSADGDRPGAEAALLEGLRLVEEFRAGLGAIELRVRSGGLAGELAQAGLRLAAESGDPRAVFAWSQRWRAGALMLPPVRPAADPDLVSELAELRQIAALLTQASATGSDTEHLREQQETLERAVRDRTRRVAGAGPSGASGSTPISVEDVQEHLGPAVLVEYVDVGGLLHALVVSGSQVRMSHLGPSAVLADHIEALRHGMRRLAHRGGTGGRPAASFAAARSLVDERARRLQALLLDPLLEDLGEHPLVVVPTGELHALPWAALPFCAARPVSVAPSASLWQRAMVHRASPVDEPSAGRLVAAAGPGLPYAEPEVREICAGLPDARCFTGDQALVEVVAASLDGAGLAHIAAHGHFRADNPLFSSLELADGRLTVYDLERLRRPPGLVVLSACESGRSAVHPGDELLGLAAALLSLGSQSLIGAVVPVPDEAARDLMLLLHNELRAGLRPAAALAAARRELTDADPWTRVAAHGFLCLGAG